MRSQSILFSIVIVLSAFGNTKGSSDVCQLGPEPGPCRAYFKRFYYTDTEEKCKEFIYGGCQGNQNNFETLQDCESACSKHVKKDCPKICTLEFEPVCGSDGKTYANKCNLEVSDCESEKEITIKHIGPCVNAEGISQICLMKPDPGFCMAYFPRFYYNPGTKKCETFIYGGCQGNMNNFETLEECESTCSSPGELPDPCLNMLCQFEGKCEIENGKARCQCPKLMCIVEYMPVCGHDGTEYSNHCLLKLAECQAQKEIKYDDGPCRFH